MRILIAFGHRARVGKDTACDYVSKKYGCELVRFAEPVYELATLIQECCTILYSYPLGETIMRIHEWINVVTVTNSEYCEHEIKHWITCVLMPVIMQKGGAGKPGEKMPWLLQIIGTDLRNILGVNIWADIARHKIEKMECMNICCPDLRFPNEFDLLSEFGFTKVKINRKDRPIDRDPNALSEIALEDTKFDYEIDNDGSVDELYQKVEEIVRICVYEEI